MRRRRHVSWPGKPNLTKHGLMRFVHIPVMRFEPAGSRSGRACLCFRSEAPVKQSKVCSSFTATGTGRFGWGFFFFAHLNASLQ